MKIYALLLALLLNILPAQAQTNKPNAASDVLNVTLCDLVHNPDIFDGKEVRLRATYLSNSNVASFVDQNCMAKDKQTWVEFDGISIKASASGELYEKLEEQILCGKCGGDNKWRETEMLVTGIFYGDDTGHGRLGKYRFMFSVKNLEEIGVTQKTERSRFAQQ
ncbi:MAG TPA: hypothetical protein VJU84_01550 [Pyrinomonadaceae bacterium]|nr:hypothetical protein [Pyrinomonadaceae bacterium]